MKKIPAAEELNNLFLEGKMERLGMGSRRTCYKIPGTKFCVKCYRSDDEIKEGKYEGSVALAPSVVREIIKARFDEKRNTSCQEYRYWKRLKERLPNDVFAAFPQTLERVLVASRGWCLVEERLENFDGSEPEDFKTAYVAADDKGKKSLLSAFLRLIESFCVYAVRFYDPQNLLVQRTSNEDFVLRIVDFEPASRSFLPIDSILPPLVRRKTMRRARRWLKMQLGVEMPRVAEPLEKREPISISFSVSDNYSQHLAVVLTSFLVNNPDFQFVFHVLHRNILEENQMRIRKLESMYANCEIKFHLLDADTFKNFSIPLCLEHVTVETYFRYCLPDLLSNENRTIYSDVDVICRSDISKIWEIDLSGKIMAAVRNYEGEISGQQDDIVRLGFSPDSPYFFTGFLVMDLKRMREEKTSQKWMSATEKYGNQVSFIDLDIINLVCEGDVYEIDRVWNETARYSPLRRDVKIWHFPGFLMKPWCNIWKNRAWPLYLKYLLKSPYRSNALVFIWGHIKGFFFYKYTKKQVTRYLICGIRIWRKKAV